jgi:hypothetical protein
MDEGACDEAVDSRELASPVGQVTMRDTVMKLLSTLALLAVTTFAAHAAVDPAEAFASIKKLQGDWRGPAAMKGMPPSRSVFRVTAGGSVVEETIFPATKMEMVSVYHMDKGNLMMTHYCALGNQPQMKLNAKKSTAQELVFDFAGGTNFNPRRDKHMHSLTMTLSDLSNSGAQKLTTGGTSWTDGKQDAAHCGVTLTRRN